MTLRGRRLAGNGTTGRFVSNVLDIGLLSGADAVRKFDELSEQEILALAISLEEEDERVYAD